jgi:Protein of unknown function (DUF3455)
MRRRLPLLGLLVLLISTLAASAVPAGARPKPPPVPPELAVPAGQEVVLDVVGKGVQIYDCQGGTWTFREPAAVLYGRGRRPVGIHFRGPTFESFDGSSVAGALRVSVPAPPQAKAIPWLLLEATTRAGDGVLAGVDWVQRIRTEGGVAPSGACDPAGDATVAVPYRARYVFWSDGR